MVTERYAQGSSYRAPQWLTRWISPGGNGVKKFLAKLRPAPKATKPVLANLASIPLTVAGIGCVDTGVFLANTVAGWIVTGLSLVVLEHLIADESAG